MSTVLRPELSKGNQYYIPKHRYYELRHFCLQYPEWKRLYYSLSPYPTPNLLTKSDPNYISDPTSHLAVKKLVARKNMDLVEGIAKITAEDLYPYLLKGVTEGLGYSKLNPPCCKEVYYDIYRKFFFVLSKSRE